MRKRYAACAWAEPEESTAAAVAAAVRSSAQSGARARRGGHLGSALLPAGLAGTARAGRVGRWRPPRYGGQTANSRLADRKLPGLPRAAEYPLEPAPAARRRCGPAGLGEPLPPGHVGQLSGEGMVLAVGAAGADPRPAALTLEAATAAAVAQPWAAWMPGSTQCASRADTAGRWSTGGAIAWTTPGRASTGATRGSSSVT